MRTALVLLFLLSSTYLYCQEWQKKVLSPSESYEIANNVDNSNDVYYLIYFEVKGRDIKVRIGNVNLFNVSTNDHPILYIYKLSAGGNNKGSIFIENLSSTEKTTVTYKIEGCFR